MAISDEKIMYVRFSRDLLQRFKHNIDRLNIKGKGQLKNSLNYRVFTDSNGHVNKIQIVHLKEGVYVDLGVGKGTKLSDIGTQKIGRSLMGRKIHNRRAKRWYLKTAWGGVERLGAIAIHQRGAKFMATIDETFKEVTQIKLKV